LFFVQLRIATADVEQSDAESERHADAHRDEGADELDQSFVNALLLFNVLQEGQHLAAGAPFTLQAAAAAPLASVSTAIRN
jgi:hypothetical protein